MGINMIFANGPNSTGSSCQSPQHCSSIAVVPTWGESCSPTSILVDVTVDCPTGLSELKRMQSYSEQLLLPQEMVYGNYLIKVWNIDDEAEVEAEAAYTNTNTNYYPSMVVRLEEEPTYNKASISQSQSQPQLQARPETMQETTTIPAPPVPLLSPPPSPLEDIDDLFLALPPSVITLPPQFLTSSLLSALSVSSSPLSRSQVRDTPPTPTPSSSTTTTLTLTWTWTLPWTSTMRSRLRLRLYQYQYQQQQQRGRPGAIEGATGEITATL